MGKERVTEVVSRVMIVAALSFGVSEVPIAAQIINEGQVGVVREEPPLLKEKLFFSSPPAWEKLTKDLKFHLCWGDRSRPEVVLTFDDGSDQGNSFKNYKILLEHHLPAVFFPKGKNLRAYPDLWREIAKFFPVCNHSQTHADFAGLAEEGIIKEIEGWEKSATEVLGEDYLKIMKTYFPFFRLPYGSGNSDPRVLRTVIKKGYVPIGWSIQAWDIAEEGLKQGNLHETNRRVVERVTNGVRNGSNILLHATEWETGDLEGVIEGVQTKGYRFVTLNRALGMEDQVNEVPKKWQKKISTELISHP